LEVNNSRWIINRREMKLYYNKRSKKSLKRALIERMYNLELAEQRTEKGSWKEEIQDLKDMLKQLS